ncbi:2-deoxy-5-keto-D-gluconate 6-phosphate aldolase domain-containing protein, partial [Salmonella enterica subsp. enterica serovar Infantis]
VRREQEALIDEVYRAGCQSGHDLLLEVIVPRDAADQNEQYYPQIVERFYQLVILPDWWKLPPLSPDRWREISQHIE